MTNVDFEIKRCREHYVVYINGSFFCSAVSYLEAIEELNKEGYVV